MRYFTLITLMALMVVTDDAIASPFNKRLYPVANSSFVPATPTYTRPAINFRRAYEVYDFNQDGILNDVDIQNALDRAHELHERNGYLYRVILNRSQNSYSIANPLEIKTGVFLVGGGANKRLIASSSFNGQYLIEIEEDAVLSGVRNIRLVTGFKASQGAIKVGDGAKLVLIYDNILQDELNDASAAIDVPGSGTDVRMINLGGNTRNIYIDGNFFVHVPTGIFASGSNTRNLHIHHNTFSQWRQRAIYFRNSVEGPITDVFISHNKFNEPKLGKIRQPIALHSTSDQVFFERININYNIFKSPNLPHISIFETADDQSIVRNTMSNRATADIIALSFTRNFRILGNTILNGGEAGISVSWSSRNGIIGYNYIRGTDTGAISVGSIPMLPQYSTENVSVLSNIIINPSENRTETVPYWARSAIGFTNAYDNYFNGNTIVERNTKYDENGDSINLNSIAFEFSAANNIAGIRNETTVPPWVTFYGFRPYTPRPTEMFNNSLYQGMQTDFSGSLFMNQADCQQAKMIGISFTCLD